jgi:hypothetical protein
MNYVAALAVIISSAGGAPLAENKDWPAEVQAIAKKCGIPSENLQFVDGGVRWIAPEASSFEQATCVFDELKARGVPMKQGFLSSGK